MPIARSIAASSAPEHAGFEQHLGVGLAAHHPPCCGELAADIAIVVDFPVEGDDISPVGRVHRLRAAGAEVDDGEPPLAKRRSAFRLDPDTCAIGATMA